MEIMFVKVKANFLELGSRSAKAAVAYDRWYSREDVRSGACAASQLCHPCAASPTAVPPVQLLCRKPHCLATGSFNRQPAKKAQVREACTGSPRELHMTACMPRRAIAQYTSVASVAQRLRLTRCLPAAVSMQLAGFVYGRYVLLRCVLLASCYMCTCEWSVL